MTRRLLVTACLSAMLLVGALGPAGASTTGVSPQSTTSSGLTPCSGGDHLEVASYASGTVYHSVDGQSAGVFHNGSTVSYNVVSAPSIAGGWLVESVGGQIDSASAVCLG